MKNRYREIADWFERLSPQTLASIDTIYAPQASFTDPFNDVRGVAQIRQVYEHMFEALDKPAFRVTEIVTQGERGFMTWDFDFCLRGRPYCIVGCTQFCLDADGRIVLHRDYWDAAREVYEHIPLLGGILRALRRRLQAKKRPHP